MSPCWRTFSSWKQTVQQSTALVNTTQNTQIKQYININANLKLMQWSSNMQLQKKLYTS